MSQNNFIKTVLLVALAIFLAVPAFGEEIPQDLKNAIEEKSKTLLELNQKILQTQKDLDETQDEGRTLQGEIKTTDKNINQLNLKIKSSEINVSKLNLEIDALQYDIKGTQDKISLQKEAVALILRELQKKDGETILTILLKNKSLAESISETQNIIDLNSGLSNKLTDLKDLNNQLFDKLTQSSGKKQKVEIENKTFKANKQLAQTQKTDKQSLLEQTKNQEKNYQSMISDLTKQQDAISEEIRKIEDELRSKFDPNLLPAKRPGVFAWPIKMQSEGGTGYITQHFGEISYLYKDKVNGHNGLDIGGVGIGTPIFAAEDGRVTAVDNNDRNTWNKYQYGKYILINHGNNFSTLYAHLSIQVVSKNDMVKRGDLIGYTGKTGYATGPHLHFGLYWTPSISMKSISPAMGLVPVGVVINPENYLSGI